MPFPALSKAVANDTEYALSVYQRWLAFDPNNLTAQLQYQRLLSQQAEHRAATEHKIEQLTSRFEPAGDGQFLNLTYDIVLKTGVIAEQLTTLLGRIDGAEDVVLIASKNDVDY